MSEATPPTSQAEWLPRRAPHARVFFDSVRKTHALLDPERVIFLSPSARAIIELCDGTRTTHEIIARLRERFPNAPLEADVPPTLASLHARSALDYSTLAPSAVVTERERDGAHGSRLSPPLAMTAELTYRCPLRCGYCSNPTDLDSFSDALSLDQWRAIIDQAADAGVLQCSFSGGEPLLFDPQPRAEGDPLAALIERARSRGMYTNLITSAFALDEARIERLAHAGLEHVQISVQHTDSTIADALGGAKGAHAQKLSAARAVTARGMALSINVVLHRETVAHTSALIELAESLGAARIELASVQSHGWAMKNRAALLPTRAQSESASRAARAARARLGSKMRVVYVVPDYFADRPKPCMDGWGRKFLTVTPDGRLLPCPGAHALPLAFDRVPGERTIEELWRESASFEAFRGTAWMPEPCASCDERDRDFGGCRCQAFALTGDAARADPACAKSPDHAIVLRAREESEREAPLIELRRYHRSR